MGFLKFVRLHTSLIISDNIILQTRLPIFWRVGGKRHRRKVPSLAVLVEEQYFFAIDCIAVYKPAQTLRHHDIGCEMTVSFLNINKQMKINYRKVVLVSVQANFFSFMTVVALHKISKCF